MQGIEAPCEGKAGVDGNRAGDAITFDGNDLQPGRHSAGAKPGAIDADLARIIDAWTCRSEAERAAILAIVGRSIG